MHHRKPSLALLTDLYQLTMAAGYWRQGLADREAAFQLFFRRLPFGGGFAVAGGLAYVVDLLAHFRIDREDRDYLAGLRDSRDRPLFEPEFLDYLGGVSLRCDIDAVPEGTAVFAHQPLVRVVGPLLDAQLLETALLNLVNFQTLVATKAARVSLAAGDGTVLEFGLRRAQGMDGGLAASRGAYLGGCHATSNVLAGQHFGIPVRGTHAHSWVMAFDREQDAFDSYAQAMPGNAILLVDTYDTLAGVRHAIHTGHKLRAAGADLAGIRLDSGDLAALARASRQLLDEAGFSNTRIVASGDLDEHSILRLRQAGAPIDVWGVGTSLAACADQPALGGVYKLSAIREPSAADASPTGESRPPPWKYRIKLSDDPAKSSLPGVQQVRRYADSSGLLADLIYDAEHPPTEPAAGAPLDRPGETVSLPGGVGHGDLLVPVTRRGRIVYEVPTLDASRERTLAQLAALPEDVKRLDAPDRYPVLLEAGLEARRQALVAQARAAASSG